MQSKRSSWGRSFALLGLGLLMAVTFPILWVLNALGWFPEKIAAWAVERFDELKRG